MKYADFRGLVKGYPVFRSNILPHLSSDVNTLRRQVSEWSKKGLIINLRRGLYTLNDDDRSIRVSTLFLANEIYGPSYISLETALSYYNIIPEAVYSITSVTSKKTQQFNNHYGIFQYHHIKPSAFDGYIRTRDENRNNSQIATKEKAIIDFLYLRTRHLKSFDRTIFASSFRFQNLTGIDRVKLLHLSELFNNSRLTKLINLLIPQLETL